MSLCSWYKLRLYIFINIKNFDCNWTRTQNHLVLKRTLNHLAKYRVWIHSETRTWHDKNIQSDYFGLHMNKYTKKVFSIDM